ncbi:MAG TPA: hypothetical protein VGI48_12590 [Caldimonas sp.]|jgi:hypothetical protein
MGVIAADPPSKKAKRLKAPPIVYSEKSEFKVTDEQKTEFLKFMELRSVLFTPSVDPCRLLPGGVVCLIDVPIILLTGSGGTQYCVGLFPKEVVLDGTTSASTERVIVWRLIRPGSAPATTTFTFFDDTSSVGKAPGIVILSDPKQQLHDGILGDGTGSPDGTKWLIWNRHKVVSKAVYIPVVVRTDNPGTPSEEVSVCGTPDPRIAND